MRVAIVGLGGVGGFLAARLMHAGHDVHLIARGETLKALQATGLHLESPLGDLQLARVSAHAAPSTVGPADLIVIGVKAWQVREIAPTLKPLISDRSVVLPLQNGVEAPDELISGLGAPPVVGGLMKILSYIVAPGHIRHTGVTPYIALGELTGGVSSRILQIRDVLQSAGVTVETPVNIQVALWEKLAFMASWGGIGAVTRAPVGVLRTNRETRDLLEEAIREVIAVANARDIPVPQEAATRILRFIDSLPEDGTTSMQRDLMALRPSELHYQNGAVVRFAKSVGLAVPVHSVCYRVLCSLEQQARSKTPSHPAGAFV